ncbi:MAG TPA: HNH endonuclease signature motif containing protein [Methylomirabilota bacterium]|nr:HNH endonuclease signature motif containing protein [Methylomirabilota bacterium]
MANWRRGPDARPRVAYGSLGIDEPPRLEDGRPNPAYQAAYYALHRDRIRAAQRAYRQRTGRHRGQSILHYRTMVVALLMERDGTACWICNAPLAGERLSVDHVIPRCQGGGDDAKNLRLAHLTCNRRKERRRWPNDG